MAFYTQPVAAPKSEAPENNPEIPKPPSRWEKIKTFYQNNRFYVWAITIGVLIISILGFFAFRPQKLEPTKEANVKITIDGPEQAPTGSEAIYKFKIENQDSATLVNMQLELVYPNGMTYQSSTPPAENLSGSLFPVPDLSPGQNAVAIVKVSVQGNVNDEKELTARIRYRYSNFNSEFTAEQTSRLRLIASDVNLQIFGPEQASNTEAVSYDIVYRNNSDHDVEGGRIQAQYPPDFTFSDSSPKPDLGQNIWNVGTVKKGANGKISVKGTYKLARPGQSQTLAADFQVIDNQGNFFTQSSSKIITAISAAPLLLTIQTDNNDGIIEPGGEMRVTMRYQNNSSVVATGVNLVATVESKALNYQTIVPEGGGEVNNNTVSWTAVGIRNFERLNPNESGTVSFTVKLNNPAVRDSSKNIEIRAVAKIKSNEYQNYFPSNETVLKVSSPAELDGDAELVSGPLQPQVGQSSVYKVTLTLKNSNNDFNESILSGFVATNINNFEVSSVNIGERNNVSYDSSTGKFTWRVGTLAAHSGDLGSPRRISFEVKVTPSSAQQAREYGLFKSINFRARDSYTNQDINLDTADVTTRDANR